MFDASMALVTIFGYNDEKRMLLARETKKKNHQQNN